MSKYPKERLLSRFSLTSIDVYVTDDDYVRIDIHPKDNGTLTFDLLPSQVSQFAHDLLDTGNRATERRWDFTKQSAPPDAGAGSA